MGAIEVPAEALYGAQTQRALDNFAISSEPLPAEFIRALLLIKRAAASANRELGLLDEEKAKAIAAAVTELLDREFSHHFPVSIFQTGSGTSTNMNANEVICGLSQTRGIGLHPNDDVNMGQSSNDVIPSALHISAAVQVHDSVIPSLTTLADVIRRKGRRHGEVIKTGRTHLMDALPIRLKEEMEGWASQIDDDVSRLQSVLKRLLRLPLGGTAVGSGVNCHPHFAGKVLGRIGAETGLEFRKADSAYKGLSSIDSVLEASGHLKTTAVSLMKIANDLRWMNSGPDSGLGEITLPALQPGSSIMPDKINPVIPEAVCMAAARVIGNDTTITMAGQAGNFQLNTMLPLAGAELLQSCSLIAGAARALGSQAIAGMTVHRERMQEPLRKNPILVTSLAPHIGYLEAARIAKKARNENRTVRDVAQEETDLEPALLDKLLDPQYLADGGVNGDDT
jgi:fumarate hydratase class II